jgi:hyperosmotically inducible periplasmic protein
MKKAIGFTVAIALAMGVAWWGDVGRAQQQGAGEKAGERLDEVGRRIKKGIDKAEGAVREGFHKTRDTVNSMGVAARVYGRLHWDKALQSSDLNVKVEQGVATISGSAPTAEAKSKAALLAAETVGVTKVIDELTIPASQADEPTKKVP